jgi:prepilin-type N-terminal cleavage/methylation domain-containing protein/prepilin-type processing-associated H-X9-DG protein
MLKRQPRNNGFTLIELLVVIAIIAILAAILFPVFSQAKEKARQATCASQLKQLALCVLMYAQDYDERLPTYRQSPGVPPGCYVMWWHQLEPYHKSWDLFVCPTSRAAISYGCNINHAIPCTQPGFTLSGLAKPAETHLMVDAAGDGNCNEPNDGIETGGFACTYCPCCGNGCQWVAGNGTAVSARHSGGAIGGFADGHVKHYNQGKWMSKDPVGNLWGHAY